jgi:hypothetical protein
VVFGKLAADGWFREGQASSIVFDWTLYNGNLDLFVYTVASFSLSPTGAIHKELQVEVFPRPGAYTESTTEELKLDKIINLGVMLAPKWAHESLKEFTSNLMRISQEFHMYF